MWLRKKNHSNRENSGFLPAVGVVAYVGMFSLFITFASKFMPADDPPLAPLLFLTLFSFSVLTCGLIVFYKPYLLFLDKKGKEAIDLVLATTKWLGILAIVVGIVVVAEHGLM